MHKLYAGIKGIVNLFRGLLMVGTHAFRPAITIEYPEKRLKLSARSRGRLALLLDNEGNELCTGCKVCSRVCPCGDLIQIESAKNEKNKLYAKHYTIDIGRCIFCGNCVEACNFGALEMTDQFELAEFSRQALVYDKKMLTLSVEESRQLRTLKESND